MARACTAEAKGAACMKSVLHLPPSGANLLHPKPIKAEPGNVGDQARSATDQHRRQWHSGIPHITEADNTNTPTHA